jgi:DNA-binding beta-propeller fold protein YncE
MDNPLRLFWIPLLILNLCLTSMSSGAQEKPPFRLVQTISLPNLKGRIDHMDVDVKGHRLFVAGLENGSMEVVDLQAGKWLRSIPGFQKPQGIAYVEPLNKVLVASGDDGMVRAFRGDTLQLLDSIKLDLGANRVTYDLNRKLLYVGYGGKDAGKDYGEVGIIDATTDRQVGDVRVGSHPAELLLDKAGQILFVLLPAENKIQVIDTAKRQVISTWTVSSQRPGDAAFDEASQRLFVGTRTPPQMIAMDSHSGKELANLSTVEGQDGVYFDAAHRRVYVSGGRGVEVGYVFVYQQNSADHYEFIGKIPTRTGAGTSFWSPEMDRYYVAAPAHDKEDAAILVFQPQ